MKICFIAPANNYHTKKWSQWFASRGHEIHIISFIDAKSDDVATVHYIDTGASVQQSDIKKIRYLLYAKRLKQTVDKIEPDVVNVHYATSYGTVAALSGVKNYALSVWGTDIYGFPNKSFLHKVMLQFSLYKAKYLFSTSKAMAEEGGKYTNKRFEITPFGVDMELFSPEQRTRKIANDMKGEEEFIVGTVKSLVPVYGIDYLLKAVAIVKKEKPEIPIKLRVAGKGPMEATYKRLAEELGIADITTWLGFIPQNKVAEEWANMDLAVVYSNAESFGVSAVEAQACETPLIISDIPGLKEATSPGESSYVISAGKEKELARAIVYLYEYADERERLGKNGREFVAKNYEINDTFKHIEEIFMMMKKKDKSIEDVWRKSRE